MNIEEGSLSIIDDVLTNCPAAVVDDFEEIMTEIRDSHSKELKGEDPAPYLEYSRGWHYVIAQQINKCDQVKTALDIGALYGMLACFMARKGIDVTGLDGYADVIPDALKEKYGIHFVFHNLESNKIPRLPREYFDLVVMSEVLEHLNYNPVPVLVSLRACIKPGGRLIITTPDDRNYPPVPDGPVARFCHHIDIPIWTEGAFQQSFPHSKQYTYEEFCELLENCGFVIEEVIKFRYEGIHMLAVATPEKGWFPDKRVREIVLSQFPELI